MKICYVSSEEKVLVRFLLFKRLAELDEIISAIDDCLVGAYIKEREDIIKLIDRFK